MTRISMQSVTKYFEGGNIVANDSIDLEVEDGEFLVLLGPSGCGKTTALRLIAGLEHPSEGELYFDDDRVTDSSPSDRNVAMVFQNYALYPHMTVRENIEYPLKIRDIPPEERDERIAETTELLHIEDLLDKKPSELSGGQRQRTSLARAIVRKPAVFLLDEPLSNLDAKLRMEMRTELKRLQDDLDVTTIYVTHNQEEAMSMGDRIAVMNGGTVRQVAEPEELYTRPRTTWVAQFIGSPPMNLIDGQRRNGTVDLVDGSSVPIDAAGDSVPVEAEGGSVPADGGSDSVDAEGVSERVSLGVRPEDLSVSADPPNDGRAIAGTVDTVEPLGEFTIVNVDVDGATVKAKVPTTGVERGDAVHLTFENDDVYLYDGDGQLLS